MGITTVEKFNRVEAKWEALQVEAPTSAERDT